MSDLVITGRWQTIYNAAKDRSAHIRGMVLERETVIQLIEELSHAEQDNKALKLQNSEYLRRADVAISSAMQGSSQGEYIAGVHADNMKLIEDNKALLEQPRRCQSCGSPLSNDCEDCRRLWES